MHRYLRKRDNEGSAASLFYYNMDFKKTVQDLLDQALAERADLFLIDLKISDLNKVEITIDGDKGVTLQDCIDISRAVEHNLDREAVDFAIDVASAGVGSPLKNVRQYKKNVGRTLKVKTETKEIEATLAEANDENIKLSWSAREPKKIGKGKETVQHELILPYADIKQAIVTITF